MENIGVVESFQPFHNLYEYSPDIFLSQVSLFFLVTRDFLEKIPIIGELHNDAKISKKQQNKRYSNHTQKCAFQLIV